MKTLKEFLDKIAPNNSVGIWDINEGRYLFRGLAKELKYSPTQNWVVESCKNIDDMLVYRCYWHKQKTN